MSERKTERWIKENVEAIAIAIVMALIIRQFAIEAFKIPTESMAPTLLGESGGGGTGDRILVFKVPYLLGEPDRWDVVVFKYPLNISKNYIKRLVGLSGEKLEIRDGDVIIDGKIARKPPHVQDAMYLDVFPGRMGPKSLRDAWSTSGPEWRRIDAAGFHAAAKGGTATVHYARNVQAGDVRLSMEVTPEAAGEVFFRIVEHDVRFEFFLAVGEGESYLMADGIRHPVPDVRLTVGRESDVAMANVDDAVVIEVDGRTFRHEYESIAERAGDESIWFGVTDGAAAFTGIRLQRDVHYGREGRSNVEIPEGHFFVLGDNTTNSMDSRKWMLNVTRVEGEDGTIQVYEWDSDQKVDDVSQRPERGPGEQVKMDRFGIWRKWRLSDQVGTDFDRKAPFVPRENMIGKAFFVFWPMNVLKDQFRLKFIR